MRRWRGRRRRRRRSASLLAHTPQQDTADGLFTEGNLVLAEGEYLDDMFHVRVLGLPPAEVATETRYGLVHMCACVARCGQKNATGGGGSGL